MKITPGLREALVANSTTFTPGWAIVPTGDPAAKGRHDALGFGWSAGCPVTPASEPGISCYIAWVQIALTADASGRPIDQPDRNNIVALCDAVGFVFVTESRILAKLDEGVWLGTELAGQSLLVSLPGASVNNAEVAAKKGRLGGVKFDHTTVDFAGASVGRMVLRAEMGLNKPWNPADRGVWQRDLKRNVFDSVARMVTGSKQPPAGSAVRGTVE